MTGVRSEWLRPINERLLTGELGPTPVAVKLATVLCGLSAAASAALAVVYIPMSVDLWRQRPAGWGSTLPVAGLVAAVAVVLFGTLAVSTWAIPRRGWVRVPRASGLTLLLLSVLALVIITLSMVDANPSDRAETTGGDLAFLGLCAGGAAALSAGLVLLLRRPVASGWLAKRRYQAALTGSEVP